MKLKENEKIVKVISPHFFTKILTLLWVFVCVFIIYWTYFFLKNYQYIFLLVLLLSLLSIIVIYYLFIWFEVLRVVITDLRIIYVKKINIFNYEYDFINLWEIIKIKAFSKWIFSNYFWYGEIIIETKQKNISILYCTKSEEVAKDIYELISDK